MNCRGKKRPFDEIENLIDNENAASDGNDTQGNDRTILRKKHKTVVAEIKRIESDYMCKFFATFAIFLMRNIAFMRDTHFKIRTF